MMIINGPASWSWKGSSFSFVSLFLNGWCLCTVNYGLYSQIWFISWLRFVPFTSCMNVHIFGSHEGRNIRPWSPVALYTWISLSPRLQHAIWLLFQNGILAKHISVLNQFTCWIYKTHGTINFDSNADKQCGLLLQQAVWEKREPKTSSLLP